VIRRNERNVQTEQPFILYGHPLQSILERTTNKTHTDVFTKPGVAMKNSMRWLILIVTGILSAGVSNGWAQDQPRLRGQDRVLLSAETQDWPQWRGANRDGKAQGFKAPQTWPKELTQKWKITVGQGDATPALVGERLYVFTREDTNEITRCLEAATGKQIWQDQYAAQAVKGPDSAIHSGPRSSPTVLQGKICTVGVCATVSCLDAAKGKVLWRKEDFAGVWPKFHTSCSPLVADGLCIVQLGGENDGGVIAYDLATGAQKWKWTEDGTAYSSPALLTVAGTKMVAAMTAKKVVGLSLADGKLLWETAFLPQGRAYNAATPIVDGQKIIFAGAGRGSKALKIEKTADGFAAKELWSNPENGVQFNTPVLQGGQVYGVSQTGTLFCLEAEQGKTLWSASLGGRGFGSIVAAGPVLIALTPQRELTVIEPSDKEFKKLASYKVCDSDTYAYPIVAGDRIFVKDQDSLTLWIIE
jgi:outer membrane protein assembly factor BamB